MGLVNQMQPMTGVGMPLEAAPKSRFITIGFGKCRRYPGYRA